MYFAALASASVAAQAPAPTATAFDGAYVGTATMSYGADCNSVKSAVMTISAARVVIHEIHFDGEGPTYSGSVDDAGKVSVLSQSESSNRKFLTVSGTISGNVFAGQRVDGTARHPGCFYSFMLQKAPTLTTAFDGIYAGVSRTSGGDGAPTGSCVPNGPPPPLTIVNGIARTLWGRLAEAEGYVSPQGMLFMRAPSGYSFDGRIDGTGTITGRFTRSLHCSYQMVYQKRTTER